MKVPTCSEAQNSYCYVNHVFFIAVAYRIGKDSDAILLIYPSGSLKCFYRPYYRDYEIDMAYYEEFELKLFWPIVNNGIKSCV